MEKSGAAMLKPIFSEMLRYRRQQTSMWSLIYIAATAAYYLILKLFGIQMGWITVGLLAGVIALQWISVAIVAFRIQKGYFSTNAEDVAEAIAFLKKQME